MKKLFLVVSFLAWAALAWAQDTTSTAKRANKLGIGIVFNDEAPLSTRIWFGPKVGMDIGLGIRGRKVDDLTDSIQPPTQRVSLVDLSFDLGIPVKVLQRERVNFLIRPGFGLRTRPDFFTNPKNPTIRSIETGVELEFNGTAGFEYFPAEKASFSLLGGFALVATRTAGNDNTVVSLRSLPLRKGVNFAFRYYIL